MWISLALLSTVGCDGGGEPPPPPPPERAALGHECGEELACETLPCEDAGVCLTASCRTEFAGGACMVVDCTGDLECPSGSACAIIAGARYCLPLCEDDADCVVGRTTEATCDLRADFIEVHPEGGCVPASP